MSIQPARTPDSPTRGDGIAEHYHDRLVPGSWRAVDRCRYLDGTTAIAEWEAHFDDLVEAHGKLTREVAILEFDGERIASLRECWTC